MAPKPDKTMPEFAYTLRIPKDRIAVVIGTKGAEKRKLEKDTGCTLEVDSSEGVVSIEGKDALGLYVCREIVLAIGRGFSPDIAKNLLKPDYGVELLSIKDFAKNEGEMIRLKGRVIGEEGKSRRTIEELTGVHVTIYGKTIGLIGELEMLPIARKAVESLLSGQKHASVYHWLETRRKEMRKREFIGDKEWQKTP
jgi:ribosomal RNA assembly protein